MATTTVAPHSAGINTNSPTVNQSGWSSRKSTPSVRDARASVRGGGQRGADGNGPGGPGRDHADDPHGEPCDPPEDHREGHQEHRRARDRADLETVVGRQTASAVVGGEEHDTHRDPAAEPSPHQAGDCAGDDTRGLRTQRARSLSSPGAETGRSTCVGSGRGDGFVIRPPSRLSPSASLSTGSRRARGRRRPARRFSQPVSNRHSHRPDCAHRLAGQVRHQSWAASVSAIPAGHARSTLRRPGEWIRPASEGVVGWQRSWIGRTRPC